MKTDKLTDAIGMISDDLIENAQNANNKKKRKPYLKGLSIGVTAAAVAFAIGIAAVSLNGEDDSKNKLPTYSDQSIESSTDDNSDDSVNSAPDDSYEPLASKANLLSSAEYPEMAQFPDRTSADIDVINELMRAWSDGIKKQTEKLTEIENTPDSFFIESIDVFLSDAKDENKVYSPLNVYMALCLLAETSSGNSREQILDVIGTDSIEELREQASAIWNANYRNDGPVTSVLANSIWLRDDFDYKQDTLERMSDYYFASAYSGEMGTAEYTNALRNWLNEQTGGLLKNEADSIELYPDNVMALVSTVYFNAKWYTVFRGDENTVDVFYSPNGETACEFMNETYITGYSVDDGSYYECDNFLAVRKNFDVISDSGSMIFILPDEGNDIESVFADEQFAQLISGSSEVAQTDNVLLNFSVPKFDVTSDFDLSEGLISLGITDIFDPSVSDFSALTDSAEDIFISQADHAARVMIDEDGCTAAAFTPMVGAMGGSTETQEVDFVLDRPFIFVIRSDVGTPLFVGVVNNPTE